MKRCLSMSILDKIKNIFGISEVKTVALEKQPRKSFEEYFEVIREEVIVSNNRFNFVNEGKLEDIISKKDMSTTFKYANVRFPRKVKFINGDQEYFVVKDKNKILFYFNQEVKAYNLDDIGFEKFTIEHANRFGIVVKDKVIKSKIALVRFDSSEVIYYEFKENCFRYLIEQDRFLVGTSPGYDMPGKMFCIDRKGNVELAVKFKEISVSAFGESVATPHYILTTDNKEIIVGYEKVIYIFDSEGKLLTRFKPSEEVNKSKKGKASKSIDTLEELSSEIADSVVSGFIAGFINDNIRTVIFNEKSRCVYIQDGYNDFWIIDLLGGVRLHKNYVKEIKFFNVTEDKVIVALEEREIKTYDLAGKELSEVHAPLGIRKIVTLDHKDIIITDNGRGYEYKQCEKDFLVGSEVGLELYVLNDGIRKVVYDASGYLWLIDENRSVELIEVSTTGDGGIIEIGEGEKFKELWRITEIYGDKLINDKYKCLYTMNRDWENVKVIITGYSFDKEKLWRKNLNGSNYYAEVSRDGEYIFIAYNDAVSYEPGVLLVLDNDGKKLYETEIPAINFKLKYCVNGDILFTLKGENEKRYFKFNMGCKNKLEEIEDEGALIEDRDFNLDHFKICYKDKKVYEFKSGNEVKEFKFPADIYEAYEIEDKQLLVKVGKRTLRIYNDSLDIVKEFKNDKDIVIAQQSDGGVILVLKDSIKYIKDFEDVQWEFNIPPKSNINHVVWDKDRKLFLIAVGNMEEYLVAAISEAGEILKSQIFDDVNSNNGAYFNTEANKMILYRNVIEVFAID